jgi:hypothetical protein
MTGGDHQVPLAVLPDGLDPLNGAARNAVAPLSAAFFAARCPRLRPAVRFVRSPPGALRRPCARRSAPLGAAVAGVLVPGLVPGAPPPACLSSVLVSFLSACPLYQDLPVGREGTRPGRQAKEGGRRPPGHPGPGRGDRGPQTDTPTHPEARRDDEWDRGAGALT